MKYLCIWVSSHDMVKQIYCEESVFGLFVINFRFFLYTCFFINLTEIFCMMHLYYYLQIIYDYMKRHI